MTKPPSPWLATVTLAGSFLATTALAGDSGTTFRPVTAKDCATAGREDVCLTAPLVSGAAVTVLDVLRDIYPGLAADGTGNRFAGAEAVEAATDPDAGAPADRAIDIAAGDPAGIAVIEAGETAYAAAVSGGVVAVAEVRPAFRPLGRLQVAIDPGGPTSGFRLLLAAADKPVVVTKSSHFNAQEQFEALHFVGVAGGVLTDLYDGPYFYSLGEATEHCELLDHQEVVAALETRKKSHRGFADIGIAIDYTAICVNGETRRQVDRKTFPLRLTYDGARYDGDSSVLDDFNASFSE